MGFSSAEKIKHAGSRATAPQCAANIDVPLFLFTETELGILKSHIISQKTCVLHAVAQEAWVNSLRLYGKPLPHNFAVTNRQSNKPHCPRLVKGWRYEHAEI